MHPPLDLFCLFVSCNVTILSPFSHAYLKQNGLMKFVTFDDDNDVDEDQHFVPTIYILNGNCSIQVLYKLKMFFSSISCIQLVCFDIEIKHRSRKQSWNILNWMHICTCTWFYILWIDRLILISNHDSKIYRLFSHTPILLYMFK